MDASVLNAATTTVPNDPRIPAIQTGNGLPTNPNVPVTPIPVPQIPTTSIPVPVSPTKAGAGFDYGTGNNNMEQQQQSQASAGTGAINISIGNAADASNENSLAQTSGPLLWAVLGIAAAFVLVLVMRK